MMTLSKYLSFQSLEGMRVAIVGADTSGLYMAIALAKRGHDVTVIESKSNPRHCKEFKPRVSKEIEPIEISPDGHAALDYIGVRRFLLKNQYLDEYIDPSLNTSISKVYDVASEEYRYQSLIGTTESVTMGLTSYIIKYHRKWSGSVDINYNVVCIGVDVMKGLITVEKTKPTIPIMTRKASCASVEVEVNYRPVTGILEDSDTEKVDSDEEPIIELQFDLVIGSDGAQSTIRNLGLFQDSSMRVSSWESNHQRRKLLMLNNFQFPRGQMHTLSTSSMTYTVAAALPYKASKAIDLGFGSRLPLNGYVSGVLGIGPDQCEDMGFDSVSMANSITKQSSTESNHDRNSGRYSPDDKSSVVSAGTSVAVQSEPKLMHSVDKLSLLSKSMITSRSKPRSSGTTTLSDSMSYLSLRNPERFHTSSEKGSPIEKDITGLCVINYNALIDTKNHMSIEEAVDFLDAINPMLKTMVSESELKAFAIRPSFFPPQIIMCSKCHLGSHVALIGSSLFSVPDRGVLVSTGLESAMMLDKILALNHDNVSKALHQFSKARIPELIDISQWFDSQGLAKFLHRAAGISSQTIVEKSVLPKLTKRQNVSHLHKNHMTITYSVGDAVCLSPTVHVPREYHLNDLH